MYLTEVLARFGTSTQKDKYLYRLLNGEIRSSFAMTEYGSGYGLCTDLLVLTTCPLVASSDATNLKNTTAVASGSSLTLNGHKWASRSFTLPGLSDRDTVDLRSRRSEERSPYRFGSDGPLQPLSASASLSHSRPSSGNRCGSSPTHDGTRIR